MYPCIYTNGVAVSGQIRLASLESLNETPLNEIINQAQSFTEKYLATAFTSKISAPEIAGVLWADELAEHTGDIIYLDLIKKAADVFQKRDEHTQILKKESWRLADCGDRSVSSRRY